MPMSAPSESCICDKSRIAAYAAGFLGSSLIMAGMIWLMQLYTAPGPIDQTRFAERTKNLADLRAANAVALGTYDWIDKNRGIVRLKVDRAKELAFEQWQNPTAFRSNLLARVDKATAKLPEKPSEYE
jgi:hypothetical protein